MPTTLDAAGIAIPESVDGRSLLGPVAGRASQWRRYIDLEHNTCYSPKNHWNALTDGRWKYIYHALDGAEQLFDLHADSGETRDLAGASNASAELRRWRARLVNHFEERGEPFLKSGNLNPRPESYLYSPNFPVPPGA